MLVEITSKKNIEQVTTLEVDLSILERITFLHFRYSGGYDYLVKFSPSSYDVNGKNIYVLNFIYINSDKIIKHKLTLSHLDRIPHVYYDCERKEFKHLVFNHSPLPNCYLEIVANYWLLQKRVDDCFFNVITEEQFNEKKEKFFEI